MVICFTLALIFKSNVVFQGAASGLKAWWEIVFPALLPFFIVSEILMKLGIVNFIGVLLEPLMRPLFNVPGAGGVVMVMGFTSGSPVGGMVTAQLRQRGLCTKTEAERLLCFTNNSSPLFMLTAIAVGMFNQPELGIIIAGAHYLANIFLGLCLRFYGKSKNLEPKNTAKNANGSLRQAFRELIYHQRQGQGFMKLLGDAMTSSVNNLLSMGAFIILFSVIIKLFHEAGILSWLASCFGLLLIPLGFSQDILTALASGFFETTIGTKMASEASGNQLQRLIAVGIMLGWSGLAMHAMVANLISVTDISMKTFIITRMAHALLAASFTGLFYNPIQATDASILPAFAADIVFNSCSPSTIIMGSLLVMVCMLLLLILVSLIYQIITCMFRMVLRLLY